MLIGIQNLLNQILRCGKHGCRHKNELSNLFLFKVIMILLHFTFFLVNYANYAKYANWHMFNIAAKCLLLRIC